MGNWITGQLKNEEFSDLPNYRITQLPTYGITYLHGE